MPCNHCYIFHPLYHAFVHCYALIHYIRKKEVKELLGSGMVCWLVVDNNVKFEILDDIVELDFLIAELIFLVFLDCRVGLPDDKVSILCIMNQ
jgi:hypothetical protein